MSRYAMDITKLGNKIQTKVNPRLNFTRFNKIGAVPSRVSCSG